MLRLPPSATCPYTLFPYTSLFLSLRVMHEGRQCVDQRDNGACIGGFGAANDCRPRTSRGGGHAVLMLLQWSNACEQARLRPPPSRAAHAPPFALGDRKSTRLNSSH